jgi:hypothetical protein
MRGMKWENNLRREENENVGKDGSREKRQS